MLSHDFMLFCDVLNVLEGKCASWEQTKEVEGFVLGLWLQEDAGHSSALLAFVIGLLCG